MENALTKRNLFFITFVIFLGSIAGGFIWLFFFVMNFGIDFLWETIPTFIATPLYPIAFCAFGGVLIGLWAKKFGSLPPELSEVMKEVKVHKRFSYNNLGVSSVAAILPLFFGGSVGPEAGLAGAIAGLCTWVGDRMKWTKQELGELTSIGLSATLGATFGTPFFGLVAPIESVDGDDPIVFPRRRKLILNIAAVFGAFAVYTLLGNLFGVNGGLYEFSDIGMGKSELLWGIPLVLLGLLAGVFYYASCSITEKIGSAFARWIVFRAVGCGVVLGLFGILLPYTMFAGEHQLGLIATSWESYTAPILIATGLIKLFITPLCINCGWRGGNIFPIIFSGACIGFGCAEIIGIDSVFCVAVVCSTLCGYVMRKPLTVALLLMLCLPIKALVIIGLVASIGSAFPIPKIFSSAALPQENDPVTDAL